MTGKNALLWEMSWGFFREPVRPGLAAKNSLSIDSLDAGHLP
jgi:hypothetical protein